MKERCIHAFTDESITDDGRMTCIYCGEGDKYAENNYPSVLLEKFIAELKKDTGCQPTNSREKQIVELFRERVNKLSKEIFSKQLN